MNTQRICILLLAALCASCTTDSGGGGSVGEGEGVATGEVVLTITPTTVVFPDAQIGDRLQERVLVKNTGTLTAQITLSLTEQATAEDEAEEFSLGSGGALAVAPGQEESVRLDYSPANAHPDTGTLEVTWDNGAQRRVVTLEGRAQVDTSEVDPPCLEFVGDATFDFGEIFTGNQAPRLVLVRNCAQSEVTVSEVRVTRETPDVFTAGSMTELPALLAASETLPITVTYAPRSEERHEGQVEIVYGGEAPLVLSVRGQGSLSACPNEAEMCDGFDNDCDGEVDEGVLNVCGSCEAPSTPELCDDGEDNDCDGDTDEQDCVNCEPTPELCDDGEDNDCDGEIDEDMIEATVRCRWGADDENLVLTSQPVVIDLDQDGESEIIIAPGGSTGRVVVLDGDCNELRSIEVANQSFGALLAAGDINGDGVPEIVATPRGNPRDSEVRAYNGQLEVIWRRTLSGTVVAVGPSIADIDQDGQAEVIVHGGTVLRGADGRVLHRADFVEETLSRGVCVADLDQDGDQEIISSNRIHDTDGSDITPASIRSLGRGAAVIGDIDNSSTPELILISLQELHVFSPDGALLFGPHPLSPYTTTFAGGLPAVGDFDGDGEAEIGVAGMHTYTVFDTGCVEPLPESCEAPGILWRSSAAPAPSRAQNSP